MSCRRLFKKDESLSLRLPRADKERLEEAAKKKVRDPSDMAWVLIREGLDRIENESRRAAIS